MFVNNLFVLKGGQLEAISDHDGVDLLFWDMLGLLEDRIAEHHPAGGTVPDLVVPDLGELHL